MLRDVAVVGVKMAAKRVGEQQRQTPTLGVHTISSSSWSIYHAGWQSFSKLFELLNFQRVPLIFSFL
jgi:hypothetical protein